MNVSQGDKQGLASDDLDITNERATKIHHIGRCRSQGTGFEPEHFVYSVVLSTDVRPAQSHCEGRAWTLAHFQQRHIRDQT